MPRFLRFLIENPILIFVLLAWVAGIVGNIVRAAKKRQESAERARRMPQAPTPGSPERDAARPRRTAEEVAAEMRRILGMDPTVGRDAAPAEAEAPRPRPQPVRVRREVVEPERAPAPVVPTTQARRLPTHVDPHVGDRIAQRHSVQSGRVGHHEGGSQLGNLGGRVHDGPTRRSTANRFALDDLKRAFVLSEILGRPLALRRPDEQHEL